MEPNIRERVCQATGATNVVEVLRLQSVWSGWGEVLRVELSGAPVTSVVVKRISAPLGSSFGHQRKRMSYAVEAAFYGCSDPLLCRHPQAFLATPELFVLEDLGASGFTDRFDYGDDPVGRMEAALGWLARFHRYHLGQPTQGLWEHGTYWHLQTRPDEWDGMADGPLKEGADAVALRLQSARHRTWVHGDAKFANICFSENEAAFVDFQYVGGGVGVSDVVYLMGGVSESVLQRHVERWWAVYFEELSRPEVEAEWRALIPFAWADFERFLVGWAPNHWKRSRYAAGQVEDALRSL